MQFENRRHSIRQPFRAEVRINGTLEARYFIAMNVSLGGVFLQTTTPLKIGTAVRIEFPPALLGAPTMVAGVVAWVQVKRASVLLTEQQPYPEGMGIQFVEIDAGAKERLQRLLEETAG